LHVLTADGIICPKFDYYRIGGQFNERLLLWQPSGIFMYSTVIIFICFMLCCRIKYDDDDDDLGMFEFICCHFFAQQSD